MTTQHDMVINNDTRTAVRADLNNALLAIASQHEGAADPSTLYKYQRRARTDLGVMLRRNAANSGDLLDGTLAETLVVAKSGAFTVGLADYQRTFICTGTWSMAFAAAATLRDGWWCAIKNDGAGVITLNPDGAETIDGSATLDLAAGQSCMVCCDGAELYVIGVLGMSQTTADGRYSSIQNDFRLSLTSGTPVTTADVTAATTIYCVPYKGNRISLYSGTEWLSYTSAQFSLALGTLTSGKPYDVFAYINAGVPTLEFLVWTDDTTRATALAYQDGVLVKSGDATRRYLGSFYTTSSTQTEDSKEKRYLFNYYHQVLRDLRRRETTATWTYQTATSRIANNNAANIVSVLVGVDESAISINLSAVAQNANNIKVYAGIGVDSTTTAVNGGDGVCFNGLAAIARAHYNGRPGIGRHYFSWLECSQASGTTTWYGATAPAPQGVVVQSELTGTVLC
jgi:hypothetical protein